MLLTKSLHSTVPRRSVLYNPPTFSKKRFTIIKQSPSLQFPQSTLQVHVANFHKNAFPPHSSYFTEYYREDQGLAHPWGVSDTALTNAYLHLAFAFHNIPLTLIMVPSSKNGEPSHTNIHHLSFYVYSSNLARINPSTNDTYFNY